MKRFLGMFALLFIALISASQHVGINTSSPTTTLDVNGSLRVRAMNNSAGNFVRTDSIGRLSTASITSASGFGTFQTILKSTTSTPPGTYANPTAVAVVGNTAYVADYNFAIHVYDVTNPQSPQLKNSISSLGGSPRDIAISGSKICVVRIGGHDLWVTGGGGPDRSCYVGLDPKYVSVNNNLAFATNGSTDFAIVDISGIQPVVKSTINGFSWKGVAGSGNYAFALDNALKVYDVSNPLSPQLVSTTSTGSGPERITIKGNLAYIVNAGANNFQIFDISNPLAPALISTTSTGSGPNRIEVQGNRAFITNGTAMTLQVFDVTIPQSPVLKSTTATGQWPSGLAVNGNYAYVSINLDKKLQIFEVPGFSDGLLGQNSDGSLVTLPASTLADNLGNHVASQALRLNDQPLYLRGATGAPNFNHGLQYSNTDNIDGPRLYGSGGGTLGTSNGTTALRWTNSGNVGIGTSTPTDKLSVVGNITATGTISSSSDIRFKTNIHPLTSTLSAVLSLQPITYNWKPDFKGYNAQRQLGFSAQELEKYFPEIVQTDKDGYKALDYSRMTSVLVQAIKDQQQELDRLKAKMERLEKLMTTNSKDAKALGSPPNN